LIDAQQDELKTWIAETLPRTTREVGAWILDRDRLRITYEIRLGCYTAASTWYGASQAESGVVQAPS
jgi:hypothetical protein